MKPPSMWSAISSQDFPYPSRDRCCSTFQAPYWKTFTVAGSTIQDKCLSPDVATHRLIRSDSVASVKRVSCSVSPLQSLPFPTRVKNNGLSAFASSIQDSTPVTDNTTKSQQLLGLKSLYRSPHLMHSLPKFTNQTNQPIPTPTPTESYVTATNVSTSVLSPAACATPSLYIDVQQLVAPYNTNLPALYNIPNTSRRIRFVRSSINTPLYDLQLRNEVHSPSPQMKRQMGSLKVEGINRPVYKHSKKLKRECRY